MIPFHSRQTQFKSVPGALATEQSLHLRITLPRSMKCSGARLVVVKEGETPVPYGMFWAGMNGTELEWWELDFTATTPGLYWYYFELDTPWGASRIMHAGRGVGVINASDAPFQLTVYDKDFTTPDWLKGGLIYQIFPDRFYNSGQTKKNVPDDRVLRSDWGGEPYWKPREDGKVLNNDFFCGDLKGIEEKLDYIAALGVNCIYLNPIFESHTNHRYDTADYLAVDPLLGGEKDLRSLCKAAKKRGIHIILDGVFSHTGSDSRYFNRAGRYDTVGAFNSQQSPYYSWYKFIEWPHKYQSWWGIDVLPELIEENPEFQHFICDVGGVLHHWMDCGVSGWRLDVADELPDCFLDRLRESVKAKDPEAIIIGEVWEDATTKFAYGQRRRYFMGGQLDSVMNYPFATSILQFVRSGGGANLADTVMELAEHYPPQVLAVVMNHIGTHDTERAITRLAGLPADGRDRSWQSGRMLDEAEYRHGVQLLKLASVLQYTLPGVPSLYYGDEAGMQGYRDPFNRYAFPWEQINRDLSVWYTRLGQIRKNCKALVDGSFDPLFTSQDSIVYLREGRGSSLLVGVNRGNVPAEVSIPAEWEKANPLLGSLPQAGKLAVPPFSAVLLSR